MVLNETKIKEKSKNSFPQNTVSTTLCVHTYTCKYSYSLLVLYQMKYTVYSTDVLKSTWFDDKNTKHSNIFITFSTHYNL